MLLRYAILAAGLFVAGLHFQFDRFSSLMLALSAVFGVQFVRTFARYRQRVGVGKAGESAVQKVLADLGVETVHDLYLPTSDGSVQLDHVALFPGSLAVIETKTYNGRLDLNGSGHWHRVGRRGRPYRISNPLWQLEGAKKALSSMMPGVRVCGLVVLAGDYTTTDGHPKDVLSIRGLSDYIADHRRRHGPWQYSEQTKQAWTRLQSLQAEYASLGKTHVMEARKKRGDRFYDFEEIWPLWLWGSLAAEAAILCVLAQNHMI